MVTIAPSAPVAHSPALQAAFSSAQGKVSAEIVALFNDWVDGSHTPLIGGETEEIAWFISKRANVLINEWLMNKRLAVLEPLSPARTGCVLISRQRVDHVRDSRNNKDSVSDVGVVELLGQLFAHGNPKYAPNPSYSNQLIMFDATYKAADPAAKGESPAGALQFYGAPFAHFRLETAYWMKPSKTALLDSMALKKK